MTEDLKQIIESLLFVAEAPLTVERFRQILAGTESGEIRDALKALHAEYQKRHSGFYLTEIAGGYQFRTRPEYNAYIRRMLKPNAPRLSKAALETLAIIAYKQPVIRSDVEHIRGVDCGGVLRLLLERKLIRILGRKEIPGRPLVYATTKLFLEVFDLKDLKDLPTPKEIEEMGKSSAENPLSVPADVLEMSGDVPGVTAEGPDILEDAPGTQEGSEKTSPVTPEISSDAPESEENGPETPKDAPGTPDGLDESSPETLEISTEVPEFTAEDPMVPETTTETRGETPVSPDITPEDSNDGKGKKT